MWILKMQIPMNEGMLLGKLTKKNNVTLLGYPLSNFYKNNKFYVLTTGFIIGEDKSKENFISDLKKDKRTIKVDMISNSFGFFLMEQHPINEIFYNPLAIYTKPVVISKEGDYLFELGCWERKVLEDILRKTERKIFKGKLISFNNKKIKTIAITTLMPNLTPKQYKALELAINGGYYGYPRKIEIYKLAKIMGISYSTYQFHLRNAERKVMPSILSSI